MQRTKFDERKARILATHVATRKRQTRAPARHALAFLGALVATAACFFLLKGATLAWQGEGVFTAGADIPAWRLWLTGLDPLTQFIANLLSPMRG